MCICAEKSEIVPLWSKALHNAQRNSGSWICDNTSVSEHTVPNLHFLSINLTCFVQFFVYIFGMKIHFFETFEDDIINNTCQIQICLKVMFCQNWIFGQKLTFSTVWWISTTFIHRSIKNYWKSMSLSDAFAHVMYCSWYFRLLIHNLSLGSVRNRGRQPYHSRKSEQFF